MGARILPLGVLFALLLSACSGDDAKNTATTITSGGPSLEKADELKFISDISWLKESVGLLDQASVPWVMGALLFTQEVGGTKGIPVIFDADAAPEVKVEVKIEVAGSTQLGNRAPLTIFESKEVILTPMKLTAFVTVGDGTTQYDRVPESVPYVGGKTVVPMYFMINMAQYDWATAGATIKEQFSSSLKSGNLSAVASTTTSSLPVPWLDCETVKITVKYKGTATEEGKYQVEATKYLAADPQVTIDLLSTLAEAAGPMIAAQTGFDVSAIVNALTSVEVPACSEPDDADKALFP